MKASDFIRSFERAVHIPWGGSGAFMTPIIVGATAYSTGKAKTISGITANDKTGKIVIHLTAPYGPFDNVLAFPALGLVPGSTPLAVEANNPPPGVGPYKVTNITPGQSYDVVKNPNWTPIPGIPSGHVNVDVKVSPNVSSNALAVLNNTADVFDWADTIPGSLLPQIKAKAIGPVRERQPRRLDVLHLLQRHQAAVQQSAGPRGGRHRSEPAGDEQAGVGYARAGLLLPAACRPGPSDRARARTATRHRAETSPRPRR